MKYHLVPFVNVRRCKQSFSAEVWALGKACTNSANKMLTTIIRREKHAKGYTDTFNGVFSLYDPASMSNLKKRLKDGDEIILHGEGLPFLIGLSAPSDFLDLHPLRLADLSARYILPEDRNTRITINLLTCHSASSWTSKTPDMCFNFASDLSKALYVMFDYENITVAGYTGFIVEDINRNEISNGKFSVSASLDKDGKPRGAHSNLADAQKRYQRGEEVGDHPGRVLTNCSDLVFPETDVYVGRAYNGNLLVWRRQQEKLRDHMAAQREQQDASPSAAAADNPETDHNMP